ncbi:MAG TPA: extracellular solute-binding protein [Acholeplasmataceae bacterium]|nr:extracellular solute-binding protein [Acholeplasmataceae bacterium]
MRKVFLLLLISVLGLVIAGCDGKESGQIVLTYANWNLGSPNSEEPNMERLMLKAFEEKYNIKVEIIERPKVPGTDTDVGWAEFLSAKASVQKLPDVFAADDIPYYVIQNWAYNITEIANKDPEYLNISEDIRNAATYDGKVMALPCAVFYAGYIINKTLYDEQGQEAPTVESTYQEFINLTKAAANHTSTTNDGVVGIDGIEHFIHWYPAQLNPDFGWFTLDEEGFHLDSEEFAQTMAEYRRLQTDTTFVYDALTYAAAQEGSTIDLSVIFPEGDQFANGNVLAKYDYSWSFGFMQKNINEGIYTWDLDFIGTPSVNGNKRVPTVSDFFTIAVNTKHPEEAYLLAKWMGFGKEGYLKRIELSKTVPGIAQVNFAPLQNDEEMLDSYFELYPSFTGLRAIIERGEFIVEPTKYLPGYINARYQGTYDADRMMGKIIDQLRLGEVQLADVKKDLNERINEIYQEAKAAFDNAIKKR